MSKRFLWITASAIAVLFVAAAAPFIGGSSFDTAAAAPSLASSTAFRIYWGNEGSAVRVGNVDGSGAAPLFTSETPCGVAIDPAAGKIYWANWGGNGIRVGNLDGTGTASTLFIESGNLCGVAIDPANNMIYWANFSTNTIEAGNLNGTGTPSTLFTEPGGSAPSGVAIDPPNNKIYWTNQFTDQVRVGNLDGSGTASTLFGSDAPTPTDEDNPIGLAIHAGKLYWTDLASGLIRVGNLNGQYVENESPKTLFGGESQPGGLAIDPLANKIYWASFGGAIRVGPLGGSTVGAATPLFSGESLTLFPALLTEQTIKVNFPGVTVGNVWVRQAGTNTDVIPPLGPQTNSVTAAVPLGTYDVWVQQGAGSYEKIFNVDCTATGLCRATYNIAKLTVHFPDVTVGNVLVRVPGTNSDVVPWSGAKTDSYGPVNLLADTYDVWAQQGNGKWEIISANCSGGGECEANYKVANLTVSFPGITAGNVLVRVPGTNSDVAPWSGAKTDSYGPVNLLADHYDVWAQQGKGKWEIIANVNCTAAGACTAAYNIASLTVNFPGVTVGNVWIRQSSGTSNDVVTPLGSKTNLAGPVNLLADMYDVWVQQGSGVYEKQLGVNCSAGGACSADFTVKTLTINFPGVTVNNIWVRTPGTNSDLVSPLGSKTNSAVTNILADYYDVWVQQGGGAYEKKLNVDCTASGPCTADYGVATLTVPFAGFSAVNVWVRVPDGAACGANGGTALQASGQTDQSVFKVLQGSYDVITQVTGNYYTYDNVDCTGAICTAKPTLTVNFPGINGVHTYVKKSDNVAGVAGGIDVANQTYKNDQAVFTALTPGKYDVVIVQGAMNKVVDDVMVIGSCASIDNIVATLTVDFPGINGVHTYVKTADGNPAAFGGGDVANTTYKNDNTSMKVLKGVYDVKVVQGAQQNVYEPVDCTSGTCSITGIVATMTVNFPGISSVHTYVKTTGGGDVDNRTYKNETVSLSVLKAAYKVSVVKGAQQNTYDVDCSATDCTLDGIVANMTVNFPGISGVHTYVKTIAGGDVDNRTYKNETASLSVLKAAYKVTVVKGAQQNTYDVDCSIGDCTLKDIVSTLTVNFTGISGVHTYVKTNDGLDGFGGGDVDNRTYQNNTTSLVLLKGFYDVKVVKGAQGNVYEHVDCTGATCSIDNIAATFTLNFPGKTGVHTYIKTNDGLANSATGGDVDNRTYQNNSTTMVLLKNYYDVVVKVGAETYILDNMDCTGNTCTYSLTVVKLLNSGGVALAGGVVEYYSGGWKSIGTTPANGVLSFAIPGAPASYSFRMTYAGYTQQKSNINIATTNPVIFQALSVVVQLHDSHNAGLVDGGVKYYASGWKTFGTGSTDASGIASMELLPGSYSFQMTWEGYTQQQSSINVTNTNPIVFQTQPVVVQLKDSLGTGLVGGGVKYYASGWKTFGTGSTNASGIASMELLSGSYSFQMTWAGYTQQQSSVNIGTTNPVEFQTRNLVIRLEQKTPPNNGISGGVAKYYASGWKAFGTTDTTGNTPSLELLPGTYSFQMTYAGATEQKSNIDITTTNPVVFQTVNEVMSVVLKNSVGTPLSGGVVRYYASGWKDFGVTDPNGIAIGPDLLPGKYSFQMTYGGYTQQKSNVDISLPGNKPLVFTTVNMLVTLKDSGGNPIVGGVVKYYAAGWKDFGTTDVNGEVRKELLPGSYSFQMTYAGYTQQQSNINIEATNPLGFQTVEMTVKLKDSGGAALTGGTVKYYASGWRNFGVTDGGGEAKLQLLPGAYSFQMTWAGYTQQKSNINITTTNPLEFQTLDMEVKLTTCDDTGLGDGAVKYYASGWKPFGTTDENGSTKLELLPGRYSFQMTWAGQTEQRSNVAITDTNPLTYKTTTVTLQYPGTIQYYASGWKTFTNPMELLPYNYTFKFGSYQTQFNVSGCSLTKSVIILKLKDHANKGLAGGTARGGYGTASGTWFVPGSTDANGLIYVYQDGLQTTMSYEMRFNNTTQVKTQDVSLNSVFEFKTNLLTLRMQTCAGAPLDGGNPRGGAGGAYTTWWFPGGATGSSSPGETVAEFFPGTYSFEMQYKATADAKVSVDIPDANTLLTWQTTNVTLGYNGDISYGGGTGDSTWFTKPSMELLPGTYKFNFRPDNRMDLTFSGCTFNKSYVALKVLDENGNGVPGGQAKPAYGGSWGAVLPDVTGPDGKLFAEIPPGYTKISMTVNQGSEEQSTAQLTASNYTWTAQILRIWLNDHSGSAITDQLAALDQGGGYWYPWGTLNASGYRDIQLFPRSTAYKFRMTYNYTSQEQYPIVGVTAGIDNFYFQTGQVISSTITQYSTGAWRTFTNGMELMPGTYTFVSPSQSGIVVAGQVLNIP